MSEFQQEVEHRLKAASTNQQLSVAASFFMEQSIAARYSYNWFWLGRPIIQYPQDMCAVQELVWRVRPDVILETGIAHGGSLILSASLLALLDLCDAAQAGHVMDPAHPRRHVVGVDIDIRSHNRIAIEAHPLAKRIVLIEGSSTDPSIISQVKAAVNGAERVLVCLDSNHTHDHVLAELEAYAPLTSVGSYCVVFDTIIEKLTKETYPDRPWGPGDNPMTAVDAFLHRHPEFEIDTDFDSKLQISAAPSGYLKRRY